MHAGQKGKVLVSLRGNCHGFGLLRAEGLLEISVLALTEHRGQMELGARQPSAAKGPRMG